MGGWRDHPRSRGEYRPVEISLDGDLGSSPLSRGILLAVLLELVEDRIIPALAGNTGVTPAGLRSSRDHPRSRGEYQTWKQVTFYTDGSSPLSRGIPAALTVVAFGDRIIPALAGNTMPSHPSTTG